MPGIEKSLYAVARWKSTVPPVANWRETSAVIPYCELLDKTKLPATSAPVWLALATACRRQSRRSQVSRSCASAILTSSCALARAGACAIADWSSSGSVVGCAEPAH